MAASTMNPGTSNLDVSDGHGSSFLLQELSQPEFIPISKRHKRTRKRSPSNDGEDVSSDPVSRTSPSFLKVLPRLSGTHTAYCCRLTLPAEFCFKHNVNRHVTMTDSTAQRLWHMRCQARCVIRSYTISNGWREFSFDHSLQPDDVLVFTLMSPSHFVVEFATSNGSTRSMHPTRDGKDYPWKINPSRLACLAWQRPSAEVPSSKDTLHGVELREHTASVTTENEQNLQKEIHPSEDRLQQLKKAPRPNMVSIMASNKLNSQEQKFCQCSTVKVENQQVSSKDSTGMNEPPEFTHLECKYPDGTTYLQIFDSDSEITDEEEGTN